MSMKPSAEKTAKRIIAWLESQEEQDWQQPWVVVDPRNGHSNHVFTRGNALLLWIMQNVEDWEYPIYFTYKGAKKSGGHVLAGESQTDLCRPIFKTIVDNEGNEREVLAGFTYYGVFNIAQTSLYDQVDEFMPELPDPQGEPNELLEQIRDSLPIPVIGADSAFYRVKKNEETGEYEPECIGMPSLKMFNSVAAYTKTLAHEMCHYAGHMADPGWTAKPSMTVEETAIEEVITEFAAIRLTMELGMEYSTEGQDSFVNNAEYIRHWLGHAKQNPSFLYDTVTASARRVDYLKKMGGLDKKESKHGANELVTT